MPSGQVLPAHTTPRHLPAREAHTRQENPSPSCLECTLSQKRSRAPTGQPSPCGRPGEAFQPMLSSCLQPPWQRCPAWHLRVPVLCDPSSAVLLCPDEGAEGCPGSCWHGSGLSVAGQQRQGWPAGGRAGCQRQRRDARISWEGDPGGMIYRDFIAASASAQLICSHKISSRWFSGDPSCWG